MSDLSPLISIVLCTRNRPDRLRRALSAILEQDYPNSEIIVVNHGSLPFPADIVADDRFVTIMLGPTPTGSARIAGYERAQGELIAPCDDLDVWTTDHLDLLLLGFEDQPEMGLVHGDMAWVDAGGGDVDPPVRKPWPVAQSPFISSGALLIRREAIRSVGGYDGFLNAYADWDIAVRISDWWGIQHIPAVVGAQERHPARDELVPAAIDDRNRVMRHALTRTIRLPRHHPARPARQAPRAFNPDTWRGGRRELDVSSVWSGAHSYASVNKGLLPALARQGVSLFLRDGEDAPPELQATGTSDGMTGRMLLFYVVGSRPRDQRIEPLIQYTMYEVDHIPRIHAEEINNYVTLLYVPCRQNLDAFRAAGVTAPISVLHHGIEPGAFPLLARPARPTFTFGTFGQQNERKGVDVLLRAFLDEFKEDEPVRLVLNATITDSWLQERDPRIDVRSGFLSHADLLNYLRELDAFVLPSRGEGFGLCGLEAMATGLPTIATNWSGPADYLDPEDSFPLDYELTALRGREFGHSRLFGNWAEPSVNHLRQLMRQLYDGPENARTAGERASRRIHTSWTWDHAAAQIVRDLDALAAGAPPIAAS